MTAEDYGYSETDTWAKAWEKYLAKHPEVLASWRQQNGRWPVDHPNADATGIDWAYV